MIYQLNCRKITKDEGQLRGTDETPRDERLLDNRQMPHDSKHCLMTPLGCLVSLKAINSSVSRIPQDQSSSHQSTSSWMRKLWKLLLVIFSIILQVFGIMWSAPVFLGYSFNDFAPTELALGFPAIAKVLGQTDMFVFWGSFGPMGVISERVLWKPTLAFLWGTWLLLQKRCCCFRKGSLKGSPNCSRHLSPSVA